MSVRHRMLATNRHKRLQIHTHTYTHARAYTHTHTHIYKQIHHISTKGCVHISTCTSMHTYGKRIHESHCIYGCACVRARQTYTYVLACACAHVHVDIYRHICVFSSKGAWWQNCTAKLQTRSLRKTGGDKSSARLWPTFDFGKLLIWVFSKSCFRNVSCMMMQS